jgi:hypothetical protein
MTFILFLSALPSRTHVGQLQDLSTLEKSNRLAESKLFKIAHPSLMRDFDHTRAADGQSGLIFGGKEGIWPEESCIRRLLAGGYNASLVLLREPDFPNTRSLPLS